MQKSVEPCMIPRQRWQVFALEACMVLLFLWSMVQHGTAFKLAGMSLVFNGVCCVWRSGRTVEDGGEDEQPLNDSEIATLLAQEQQVSERFSRAMELLCDERLEVRLGGIYALEQHIRDSAKDQGPTVEVLAAYVRDRASWEEGEPTPERLDSDIQAVLTVLARRPWSYQKEDKPLDLHGTVLTKAYLPFAHLERAFLYRANLDGAMLHKAHLEGAWLWGAHLKNANLDEAHLEGADLADAVGLTWPQLQAAYLDDKTALPDYLLQTLEP